VDMWVGITIIRYSPLLIKQNHEETPNPQFTQHFLRLVQILIAKRLGLPTIDSSVCAHLTVRSVHPIFSTVHYKSDCLCLGLPTLLQHIFS
jgi:hypothetical protein